METPMSLLKYKEVKNLSLNPNSKLVEYLKENQIIMILTLELKDKRPNNLGLNKSGKWTDSSQEIQVT